MSNFISGFITAVFLIMVGYTIKINVNPEPKTNTKIKIYIDGNACKVQRELVDE